MKRTHLTSVVAALLCSSAPSYAEEYILVVPKAIEAPTAEAIMDAVDTLVENFEADDRLTVLSADFTPTVVAQLQVTETNRNRKKREISQPLGTIADDLVKRSEVVSDGAATQVYFPQVMTEISTQLLAGSDPASRKVCVMVIGDALYTDPREPAFSMASGAFATDGLLLASQSQSIFGTADKQGFLQGVNIHFQYTTTAWESDVHNLRVHRMWWLFTKAQGGELATFTADSTTSLQRWSNCAEKAARRFDYDSTRAEVGMMTWNRAEAPPIEETTPQPAQAATDVLIANDDFVRSDTVTIAESAPEQTSGHLKVGIRWGDNQPQCHATDLDVYARATPTEPFLYFGNKSTKDGFFEKDMTSTDALNQMANGIEVVNMPTVSDFKNVEIMVNHFGGVCEEGVKGVVRAYFNGSVYEYPFHIQATEGSGGRGADAPSSHPAWVIVPVTEMFRL